jgi:hypothetical protein
LNWRLFSKAVVEPCTMNVTFSLLLAFLVQFFLPRHDAQLRLLKAQFAARYSIEVKAEAVLME